MAEYVTLKKPDGTIIYPQISNDSIANDSITQDKIAKFKAGDTVNIGQNGPWEQCAFVACGYVTGGGVNIAFNIPLPKSAVGTTPTFSSGKIYARHVGGGYVLNNADITSSSYVTALLPLENNSLGVNLKQASGSAWSVTNNTPLVISGYFTITF